MIYLDHAATTPMDPEVIEVVRESMERDFGNSGTVYRLGLDVRKRIERATEEIAQAIDLPSTHRIVYTSGGSESNNLLIKGLCFPDKRVAYLGLEHPSVTAPVQYLKSFGNEPLCLLGQQISGRLDLDAIPMLKTNRVRLLCLSHVNNEIGTIHDPEEVFEALQKDSPQTRLFLDGVQGVGKRPLSPSMWSCLAGYSMSGHKIYGPKGIGLLIYNGNLSVTPQIHGGGQQHGVRSGTLPAPLILGLARAVTLTLHRARETEAHLKKLHRHLVQGLRRLSKESAQLDIRFNPEPLDDMRSQTPAIINFSFPPVEGEVLLHHLEEENIFVGMGSACSAQSKEPSKILTGIGLSAEESRCSLRVSFGHQNTLEEIDTFLDAFSRAYEGLHPTFSEKAAER